MVDFPNIYYTRLVTTGSHYFFNWARMRRNAGIEPVLFLRHDASKPIEIIMTSRCDTSQYIVNQS